MVLWGSPFLSFGEELFEVVRRLFDMRPDIHAMEDTAWEAEYELGLRAMETAMSRLDKQGIFGAGATRSSIVLNVEVMPPDYPNTERAMRLNPPEALHAWLEQAAEME